MFVDFYEVLGIASNATEEQIKKAYRLNAIKYHPDKHFGDPYFANKFLEIKHAYDNLIDGNKRKEFDVRYNSFFANATANETYSTGSYSSYNHQNDYQNERKEEKTKQKAEEEKFRFDPYKPFYSPLDREQQSTPQVESLRTPWGEEINAVLQFFSLPKNIGKIIGGYSTLIKGTKKTTYGKLFLFTIIDSWLILPLLAIIMFLLWNNWHNNLHKPEATQTALIAYGVISAIIIFFKLYAYSNAVEFNHENYFIGINGFAVFKCQGEVTNIISSKEVNFNDITDLVTRFEVRKKNFQYVNTAYQFVWMNTETKKVVFAGNGKYEDKDDNPSKAGNTDYWLNKEAEKYWTVYLLDTLEKKLEKDGYVEFKLYSFDKNVFMPYIRIGIGFIAFLSGGESFTYKFNEIKRIYTKGGELYIEHKNFEKKLFFFKSGNQNSIPLRNLSNRNFFYKALEILVGYSVL